ncbi:MAG: glycoside hydrolase family 9 protein [candidate division KSB1 bacterium]|nr:glycoside hydrolase family 9 protein [candidate division KSB1 bacterium]
MERHVSIQSRTADLKLYDGRNKAQNGWFVVRSLIPTETSGKVIEWFLKAGTKPDWIRTPVIAHSQLGYHPNQDKTAVIELDMRDEPLKSATLFKVDKDGSLIQAYSAALESWGDFLRYQYLMFDFSSVQKSGIYVIEYGDQRTRAFRIAEDIYETAWYPSLEVYMPVQMDHMLVNEAYRVWHGASHLDDALQAPVNHTHFDLYAQGPETDSPYEPGEHIPGLNVGGWYDAGDYDIRTQTQYSVVSTLVDVWEEFGIRHDDTYVNQQTRRVELHHPDGVPDVLQQIEHGVLQLLAQHRAVGHAIPGIIVGHLHQYHHLGDGLTMTDNLIYDSDLAPHEKQGNRSGNFDDRWAFTSKSTPLNYGSAAGLAAASRALKDYKPELADECLKTAQDVWESEHSQEPDLFRSGNVTGGNLTMEELNCAIQLLRTTGDEKYADRIQELWPSLAERFNWVAPDLIPVLPELGESINAEFKEKLKSSQEQMSRSVDNPFGVPISRGTWGGGGWVTRMAVGQYKLHKAFPDIIGPDGVFKALNYIHGCHPGSSISFVSGVGTWSKKVAYGSNRADFSFIAGGVAPGVVVLKPDFPENKEDWPFFWGENEYVVSGGPVYIYAANAAHRLLNEK